METHLADCGDGTAVRLTLHGTAGPVVILQPATAVHERIYHPFAAYLATRGCLAVTYNYRGVGEDAGAAGYRHLRMRDWIDQDVNAVIRWLRASFPDRPIMAVGHSLGGHAIGLADASRHLDRAVLIASQAASIRLMRGRVERLRVRALLQAIGPVGAVLCGYIPAKRLRFGEDFPAPVLRDWRRWVMMPHYFFDDPEMRAAERFARLTIPLRLYGFDDDPWATAPAIDLMARYFTRAEVSRRQIEPGSGPIGHMGFFKQRHSQTLWPEVADWLLAAD